MELKPHIICVDDERALLNGLKSELTFALGQEYKIEIADSGEDGVELYEELIGDGYDVPVIISDYLMPGMKGDEFLKEINRRNPRARKIMLTGQASAEAVGRAVNEANLYRFIPKPWDQEDLALTVQQAIKSYYTDNKLDASIQVIQDINRYATFLSEEVHLEPWIEKLLTRLMDDVAASRALLKFYDAKGTLRAYEATRRTQPIKAISLQPEELAKGEYPDDAFEQVEKTRKPVVFNLDEVKLDALEADWSRFNSFYCAPLLKQDRLLGYLYLENRQSPQFFKDERLEFLNALITQAPISLDNALLYDTLEQKVRERTAVIEEKNKSITASINYARRIQFAILPPMATLKDAFPDSFVFYEPKDIVCGDFYWWTKIDHYLMLSAIDCTGHGVPGAFMSVLGDSLLNQIVKERKNLAPEDILEELHEKVYNSLISNNEGSALQDGMDLSFLKIDTRTREVEMASANRPVLHYKKAEDAYEEYKGDRQPIGGSLHSEPGDRREFTKQVFQLYPGDALYLFSDGITDQFGGKDAEKMRKYTFKRLQETIAAKQELPMADQYEAIKKDLEEWQGDFPQTDDILLIGLRVNGA